MHCVHVDMRIASVCASGGFPADISSPRLVGSASDVAFVFFSAQSPMSFVFHFCCTFELPSEWTLTTGHAGVLQCGAVCSL